MTFITKRFQYLAKKKRFVGTSDFNGSSIIRDKKD
jgi:hypothetical protein